jgi:hypothetical protein
MVRCPAAGADDLVRDGDLLLRPAAGKTRSGSQRGALLRCPVAGADDLVGDGDLPLRRRPARHTLGAGETRSGSRQDAMLGARAAASWQGALLGAN